MIKDPKRNQSNLSIIYPMVKIKKVKITDSDKEGNEL